MQNILHKSLGITAVAIVAVAFAYGNVFAAEKEKKKAEPKPPACNSLKDETACKARDDCSWVAASIDSKTQKEKRKAYCRTKPKAPAKKTPDKKT